MVLDLRAAREGHFYPRPHMEGDKVLHDEFGFGPISTHALTWRATTLTGGSSGDATISTHALTWRATDASENEVEEESNFYPRPHMEGDMVVRDGFGNIFISTHALTWRATANMLKCRRAFQQLI